jgi:CRISPR-associated exonuclease Cas4
MIGRNELKLEQQAMTSDNYLRINEIKNYLYCPRTSYYALCLGIDRETDLSHAGIDAEYETKKRMKRRKNALHAIHAGERQFDVPLVSQRYHLVGRLDELVVTSEGVYLVDYKDTNQDYGYWRMQMTAYRVAVEETGVRVLGCYIYTIPNQQYQPLAPRADDEKRLVLIIDALTTMLMDEQCPAAVDQISKCRSCQYANFCGDVF